LVERLRELIATADPELACALAELIRFRELRNARQRKYRESLVLRNALRHIKENKDLASDVTQTPLRNELRHSNEINELDGNVTGGDTSTLTYLLKKERKKEEDSKEERKIRGARKNGFRLPDDWNPREADFAMAVARLNGSAKLELEKFRDYWKAQPGQRGTKLDWDATFRNWVRNARTGAGNFGSNGHGRRKTNLDAFAELDAHIQQLAQAERGETTACEPLRENPVRLLFPK
jgi:hypothetical protein